MRTNILDSSAGIDDQIRATTRKREAGKGNGGRQDKRRRRTRVARFCLHREFDSTTKLVTCAVPFVKSASA